MISVLYNVYYDNGIKFFCMEGKKLLDDIELVIESYMDMDMDMVLLDCIGKI